MERITVIQKPRWSGAYENWTRKWVRQNFWRVALYLSTEEDAVQECAILFIKVCNKYAETAKEPAHIMSLYKTTVFRQWILWSNRNHRVEIPYGFIIDKDKKDDIEYNEGFLVAKIGQASWELRLVLEIIAKAPPQSLKIMLAAASAQKLNSRIKRMCGLASRRKNVIKELKDLCTE